MKALGRLTGLVAVVALAIPRLGHTQSARKAAKARVSQRVSISVRVVDVAGERAYVDAGSEKGLRDGDAIRFGNRSFEVVSVTRRTAAVALGDKRLAIGATGRATVLANRPEQVVLAPPNPAPLSSFEGTWPRAKQPSKGQNPEAVPLRVRQRPANRVVLQDAMYGVLPLDEKAKFVGNELRGRLHLEPLASTPFGLDVDLGLLTFFGDDFSLRPGAAARQVVRVRELSAYYGTDSEFRAALGRLRSASAAVGELDGLKLEAPLTDALRLSAFGGTAPQTFNGMISSEVARFGAELVYTAQTPTFHARASLGAHASHFDGALDERKLYAMVDLLPERSRIGGHAEVSLFDTDNPWNAQPVELTAAGLDADIAVDMFHFGGRAELRRPDRTRYLLSLLPIEWLCWSDPALPDGACSGDNASYLWVLDAGANINKFFVDIGGQSAYTTGTDATNFGGFANLRFLDIIGRTHLDIGMTAYTGSLLRSLAAELAPGIVFARNNADLTLRYRLAAVRYRADLGFGREHSLGAALWTSPSEAVELQVEGNWVYGLEVNALVVQSVVAFHLDR